METKNTTGVSNFHNEYVHAEKEQQFEPIPVTKDLSKLIWFTRLKNYINLHVSTIRLTAIIITKPAKIILEKAQNYLPLVKKIVGTAIYICIFMFILPNT